MTHTSTDEVHTLWSSIKLLLASDDAGLTEQIRHFVVMRGGSLELCSLSVSAFERLLEHERDPLDLILLDDNLEGGRRVSEMVRALGERRPGLILLTHASRWYERSLWGDTDRDLECPFKTGDLIQCLSDVLNARQHSNDMTSISGASPSVSSLAAPGRVIDHDNTSHSSELKRMKQPTHPSLSGVMRRERSPHRTTGARMERPPRTQTQPRERAKHPTDAAPASARRKHDSASSWSRSRPPREVRSKLPTQPSIAGLSQEAASSSTTQRGLRRGGPSKSATSSPKAPPGRPSRSRTPISATMPSALIESPASRPQQNRFDRVGTLRRGGLVELLCQLYERRMTGMLTVRSEEDERSIYFSDGCPIQAVSRNDAVPLRELLVQLGMIRPEVLRRLRGSRYTHGRLGQLLLKQRVLTLAQLNQALHIQIQELILSCFHMAGAYAFQINRPVPIGLQPRRQNPLALIAAGIRDQADTRTMTLSLAEHVGEPIVFTERIDVFRPLLQEVLGDGAALLDELDGERSLEDLIEANPERLEWLQEAAFLMPRARLITFGRPRPPRTGARVRVPSPDTSGAFRPFAHTPNLPQGRLVPLAPGTLVAERYEIRDRIGVGQRASIYEALDHEMDEACALKVLSREGATPDQVSRFKMELSIGRRLVHKNIVRVYNLGSDGQLRFLVMEHVGGRSLRALLSEGGTFPMRRGVELLVDLLRGLEQAHQAGIVHRNLTPDNLLITRGDVLKISNFGLALTRGVRRTMPGLVIGTLGYIAPEQLMGSSDITPAADLYGVGCVAYEMFAGRPPFEAGNPEVLKRLHLKSAAEPPSRWCPDMPLALERLILHMLEKEPEDRPRDCGDVLERALELLKILTG